ncbi:ATP-binding protein [Bdellovibrio sp. HCB209]|uniref:ATP-binding protein n=1 Tax=Bdellovibrio sp. HCB209 TaxID=3394354 RepID=UPI0039B59EC9
MDTLRSKTLERYHILGTKPEEAYDELTRLAADVCEVPIALISFVDQDCMWFKSHVGTEINQIDRSNSFCNMIIHDTLPVIVPDARLDDRFKDLAIVRGDPNIRFYAGVPLVTPDGVVIGSLCVLAHDVKYIAPAQLRSLERIAKIIMQFLESRVIDIDERHAAEKDLEKQKEFLNAVLENLSDGVIACDSEGQVHLSNQASRRFHGLDGGAPMPQEDWPNYYQLYHADGERLMELKDVPLYRAFHGEMIRDQEMVVKAVTGKKVKLSTNGRAFFDKDGKKIGAVVTLRDITEVYEAKSREHATNMTLKKLIDLVPVGISILDENKLVTTWNKASEHITEWSEQDVLGKSIYTALAGNDGNTDRIANQVNEKSEHFSGEMEYTTKSGKKVDVQIAVVPLFDGEGRQTGSMGVSVNISDIRERERRLMEANRALKEASRAKSDFLANMSHEIRTPLNGVMAMSELVSGTILTDDQKAMIDTVQSSAGHLLTIVNDILDFSNVEAGKIELANTKFDMKDLVQQTLYSLEPLIHAKNLRFNVSLPEKMGAEVKGDASRIRQVILNLLGNAVKFTQKGEISAVLSIMGTHNGKQTVRFEVTDTGCGIPSAKIESLFEAFSQADASVTRKHGGTGLGLSISQRLIMLMNGQIGVESVEGQGSKFWFTIPLDVIEREEVKPKSSMSNELKGVHILIAEDNQVNQVIIQAMVTKLGATCEIVENGRLAIEALHAKKYDLVLMDCQMPEMDGYEATRTIRARASDFQKIPIIAVTAHAMSGDREKCLEAGMDEYLTKPLSIKSLSNTLNYVFPLVIKAG